MYKTIRATCTLQNHSAVKYNMLHKTLKHNFVIHNLPIYTYVCTETYELHALN